MSITPQEFQSFTEFGLARLSSTDKAMSLDDIVIEWDSHQNSVEINDAIRQGIADADAGRSRPAAEVLHELRAKHGLND